MVDEAVKPELETLRKLVIDLARGSVYSTDHSPTPSNIPIPDPSVITAQIIAEVKVELRTEFKELIEAKAEMLLSTGISRHEKALIRIDNTENRLTASEDNIKREALRLSSIFDEKLLGKQLQIDALNASAEAVRLTTDKYTDAMRDNATEAISAAFASAKEVSTNQRIAFEQQIKKSEDSTTKEIESLKDQLNAVKDTSTERMATVTGRLDRGEGNISGVRQSVSDNHQSIGNITGIIGGVAAVLMLVAVVVFNLSSSNKDSRPSTAITLEPTASQSTAIERSRVINDKLDLLSRQLQNTLPPPLNNRN